MSSDLVNELDQSEQFCLDDRMHPDLRARVSTSIEAPLSAVRPDLKVAVLIAAEDFDSERVVDCGIFSSFAGVCRYFPITKQNCLAQIMDIKRQGFDVFVNHCRGGKTDFQPGIEVVQALEHLNVAFTGASSLAYDLSREAMKMAFHSAGLEIPAYVLVSSRADVEKALKSLRWPLIIKAPFTMKVAKSRNDAPVMDAASLLERVDQVINAFGGALIEDFIEGQDVATLVTHARQGADDEDAWVLEPVEFTQQGIWRPVKDPVLSTRLRAASAQAFQSLNGAAYLLCRMRVNAGGEIYMLDARAACDTLNVSEPSDPIGAIFSWEPGGRQAFFQYQVENALRRRALRERSWERRYVRDRGFGLYARRDIAVGDVIQRNEESEISLVSADHVRKNWRGLKRDWFEKYAWPLTDTLHVLWSDNPERWQPINHSCNPNAWLDGLDLVARRDIPDGEELTIDYATFGGPRMRPFHCSCRAPNCRHAVTGFDYLLPEIRDAYRGHVSDFVEREWRSKDAGPTAHLYAEENAFGLCVRTKRNWEQDEVICEFTWDEAQSEPTAYTIQFDETLHAEPSPSILRYINHSCDPNALFDTDRMVLRALRDIETGDELSFFYPSTEWKMRSPFLCQCKTQNCLGKITGAHDLSKEQLSHHVLTGVVKRRLCV